MSQAASDETASGTDGEFLKGLGRAFAGALIFSLPILMTMEMWWLGFYLSHWRIVLLLLLTLPLLLGLSHYGGLRPTASLADDVADVLVAVVTAVVAAVVTLTLFGVLDLSMPPSEIIGKITLQAIPGSIGAMLARSQLGEKSEGSEQRRSDSSYWGELFIMAVGALFLSFNVAPTEEMILIAYKMSVWQEMALLALSLSLMHAFVFTIDFRGGSRRAPGETFLAVFARFTVAGYAVVLLVSALVLWSFGRLDGVGLEEALSTVIVLSFPGAIGAAAARLIL
jgi:putative integral membrane protein (TIGR02587 family)